MPNITLQYLVCGAIAVGASMLTACGTPPALAQGAWWEGIQGGGSVDFSNTGKRQKYSIPHHTADDMKDLRTGPTPMLSDVMLRAMQKAAERYEKIVAAGGWPMVPPGRMMRVDEDDARVPALRKRLRMTGDLPADTGYFRSENFDSQLEEAVKRFQRRHGLRPTGRIERSVYPVLNVSAADRLNQIRLNISRLQSLMYKGSAERYVFVNAAGYQLEAVERYEVQERHRVIVGKPGRDTPNVSATITALNFFPYWRVPDSVATLDLIPRLQQEPNYLDEEGIRVYQGYYDGPEVAQSTINWVGSEVRNYKFKQDPGPKNALGLVRIDMSNEHNVYMHDTPMKQLFNQRTRAFSAGCVRVQGVFKLVEWLASTEPGWQQPGQVQRVIDAGQPLTVNLTRPVPVTFGYITAWAEPQSGRVEFRQDIYGRDGDGSALAGYVVDENDTPPADAAAALSP